MRILIFGGRGFANQEKFDVMMKEWENVVSVVVHGHSEKDGVLCGADRMADEWGKKLGVPVERFRADWNSFEKNAGPVRNAEMLDTMPDVAIGFPGGRGTKNMKEQILAAQRGGTRIKFIEVL